MTTIRATHYPHVYRTVNIMLAAAFLIILLLSAILRREAVPFGITDRLILSSFCFFNAGWWCYEDRKNQRHLGQIILLVCVGFGAFITALMGYGFNR